MLAPVAENQTVTVVPGGPPRAGCLAKDGDARPASAEEVRLALQAIRAEVLAAAGLSPAPISSGEDLATDGAHQAGVRRRAGTLRRFRRSLYRLAAALLLLFAAGLMLYSLRRDGMTTLRFPDLRRSPVVRWAPPPRPLPLRRSRGRHDGKVRQVRGRPKNRERRVRSGV